MQCTRFSSFKLPRSQCNVLFASNQRHITISTAHSTATMTRQWPAVVPPLFASSRRSYSSGPRLGGDPSEMADSIDPRDKSGLFPHRVLLCGSELETFVCALSVVRKGSKCTLVNSRDRERRERNPNAVLLLTVDAVNALSSLAPRLLDSIKDRAVRVDHFTRFDHMGVHWGNIEYKPFVEEHRANVMSIPYEHLVDVLARYAEGHERIRIDSNNAVLGITQTLLDDETREMQVNVKFERPIPQLAPAFDVVIGADGPKSPIRALYWKPAEILYSPLCVKRYSMTIKRPVDFPHNRYVELWGHQQIIGFAPIDGDQLVVWAYATGDPATDPYKSVVTQEPISTLLEEFASFEAPQWKALLPEIQKLETMSVDYLFDFRLQSVPFYNQIGLTGAASRGILPFVHGHDTTDLIMDAILHGELIGRADLHVRHYFTTTHTLRSKRTKYIQTLAMESASGLFNLTTSWRNKVKRYLLQLDNSSAKLLEKENRLVSPVKKAVDPSLMKTSREEF